MRIGDRRALGHEDLVALATVRAVVWSRKGIGFHATMVLLAKTYSHAANYYDGVL